MTTERKPNHAFTALWVIAPVTAGLFGLTTEWALAHNPMASAEAAPAAPAAPATPATSPRLKTLQAKLAAETARYEARRRALLAIQRDLRAEAAKVAALSSAGSNVQIQAPASAGSAPAPPAPAPAPAPAPPPAAPAPPPVDTSTGAS